MFDQTAPRMSDVCDLPETLNYLSMAMVAIASAPPMVQQIMLMRLTEAVVTTVLGSHYARPVAS